jgi:hypothetical protein
MNDSNVQNRDAAAQLATKTQVSTGYNGPDNYPAWLQEFISAITGPALQRLEDEYKDIWTNLRNNCQRFTYTYVT